MVHLPPEISLFWIAGKQASEYLKYVLLYFILCSHSKLIYICTPQLPHIVAKALVPMMSHELRIWGQMRTLKYKCYLIVYSLFTPCHYLLHFQVLFLSHFITNMDPGIDRSKLKKVSYQNLDPNYHTIVQYLPNDLPL
jgi:hypothetical protein